MAGNTKHKTAHKTEFGDWQTPADLAKRICSLVAKRIKPRLVFEPNCGKGAFLRACIETFPDTPRFIGLEINADYVRTSQAINHDVLEVVHSNFFDLDWTNYLEYASVPVLVIGNPPWVTNAELMRLKSENFPSAVYSSLDSTASKYTLGMRNRRLVSNTEIIDRYAGLVANGRSNFVWRSGIKHDCSKIMELRIQHDGKIINGFGQTVDIEDELLFPMLKSSDLANGKIESIRRMMLVPQQYIGSDTSYIASLCPKTWRYLQEHADRFGKRGSSIYRNQPQFSIFGVGEYSFKPWKVAISGLYKMLNFRVIGPYHEKPVVFDDTCYFLACKSKDEATLIKELMQSQVCSEILNACIFWDSKRPITRDVLSVINIPAIARHLGVFDCLEKACPHISFVEQPTLF